MAECRASARVIAVEVLSATLFEERVDSFESDGVVGAYVRNLIVIGVFLESVDFRGKFLRLCLIFFGGGVFAREFLGVLHVAVGHCDIRAFLCHCGSCAFEFRADLVACGRVFVGGDFLVGEGKFFRCDVPLTRIHCVVGFVDEVESRENRELLFAGRFRDYCVCGGFGFCLFLGFNLGGFGFFSFRLYGFFLCDFLRRFDLVRRNLTRQNGRFALGLAFDIGVDVCEHALYAFVVRCELHKLFESLFRRLKVAAVARLNGRDHQAYFLLRIVCLCGGRNARERRARHYSRHSRPFLDSVYFHISCICNLLEN